MKNGVMNKRIGLLVMLLLAILGTVQAQPVAARSDVWRTVEWRRIDTDDCALINAQLTFYDDGTGRFWADGFSENDDDAWLANFAVKGYNGNVLFNLGQWASRTLRSGDVSDTNYYAFDVSFQYDPNLLWDIGSASMYYRC